jgi:hypothetical protein
MIKYLCCYQLQWMSSDLGIQTSNWSGTLKYWERVRGIARITAHGNRDDESTEMKSFGIPISKTTLTVFCKLFEDNAGTIHLAKVPKMYPRTQHINQNYHHFREWVKSGLIDVLPIDTLVQPADLLTKSLDLTSFVNFRSAIMGW